MRPILGRWRRPAEGDEADRGVIDIGSNTVRMVIFTGSARAPEILFNEKVTARLGRDLAATGRIPDRAQEIALAGLRRFHILLQSAELRNVTVVATAAARDAENGGEFLQKVRQLGFEPRLLTGEEEAVAAATGVLAAFPDAHGVVADLGGGSLELVCVEDGGAHQGVSLPFGTLRLKGHKKDASTFKEFVHDAFASVGWAVAHPGPLYLVGGTWRAFAQTAMLLAQSPLSDTHGFELGVDEAETVAKQLVRADPTSLKEIPGISSTRAEALPDAAALLRVMLTELQPSKLVFSSWGLREGLLYQQLPRAVQQDDPLLVAISRFASTQGGSDAQAAVIVDWTAEAVGSKDAMRERLRLVATTLATAAARLEPNIRVAHAVDWAMHKRWTAIDMAGRARIAAALTAASGRTGLASEWANVASEDQLYEAMSWGLAIRLCRRIGIPSRLPLGHCVLARDDDCLTLRFYRGAEGLCNEAIANDLAALAVWLGLRDVIEYPDAS